MNDWTDVRDALPEAEPDYIPSGALTMSCEVLAYVPYERYRIGGAIVAKYMRNPDGWWSTALGQTDKLERVTQWMPLPEPPKEFL